MPKQLSATAELRTALMTWVVLTLVMALILYFLSELLANQWYGTAMASLASAGVSVAAALLITELVLKPLYVRDILGVAQLSSQVYNSGLAEIQRLNRLDLASVIGRSTELDLVGRADLISQVWSGFLESASSFPLRLRVHVPEGAEESELRVLEKAWKAHGCEAKGSSLVVIDDADQSTVFSLLTPTQCLVAVGDGLRPSGNPLLLVFSRGRPEPYVESLTRSIVELRESQKVPVYETKLGGE